MSYSLTIKEEALSLRRKGFSIKEVAAELKIAKSTSSVWLKDVLLDGKAQNRLKKRKILGQYKSRLIHFKKREEQQSKRYARVEQVLSKIKMSKELSKLCCSLLYWCEGNKGRDTLVRFTNSDPQLIKMFLSLLRKGFDINESKFRALIHLHQYHDEEKQKVLWHEITKIPLNQFNRSYWKPNTGKRKHNNYPGCIAISYYDAEVAKELTTIYNSFVQRGVGQW